ncbi:MAG: PPC domain-containing DNA-binding protein [Planctomycetota bacterium]|jgi:predicted DNA-binding protein with PD1-like motif
MESASFSVKAFHIVRIDPGEDVLGSVEAFLAGRGVRQAVVVGGYGTLAAHHLHWVTHNRLPAENTFGKGAGGIEILSMNGLVVEGAPHIHVTLSTPDGAYGGHLEPGCVTYVLCEVFLAEVEGVALSRERVAVEVPEMGRGEVPRLMFGGP